MGSDLPADLAAAVRLGGEMGERFAAFDWDSHPLGPLSGWAPEIRSAVAVALTSRFPIVLWLDPENLYLIYNDAYVPMLGEKHPDALGRRGREVWWDIWDPVGSMLSGVVTTGAATWSDDLLLPVVTGGRPWERYFTFSYGPIIAATGEVNGVFCAVTETTERVLGQRRLGILNTVAAALMETHTVDEAIHSVLDVSAGQRGDLPFVAVYVSDPDSEAGRLYGATPLVADLMPSSFQDLVASEAGSQPGSVAVVRDLDVVVPSLSTAFETGCPEQALVLPVADSGQGRHGGAMVIGVNPRQPLDDEYRGFCRLLADQLSAAFATASSYERERERADVLAELDQAKTAFLTNVSHEFRTPLTLLLGPLDDAIVDSCGQPLQVDRLESARRNARRLLRLVNSLLDFSRAEAGRLSPVLTAVDLGALTAQITSSFTEICQRAGIELVVKCTDVTGEVDVGMWETIVLNLLSNAVKFTFSGSITVTVTSAGSDGIRVSVSDTGTGIAAEDLGRLFDRFFRAGNSRGRSVEGSGIGLSLVRELVELHGGTVEIDSELDVGTTVSVRLPSAPEQNIAVLPSAPSDGNPFVDEAMQWLGTDLRAEDATDRSATRSGRGLVLIADDNADMRQHLHRILSARWDTVVFGDGEAALRGTRLHRPDLIVTDVMMPALDGFGFIAAVRADPSLAETPVVMLSARAGGEAADEGFSSGADDYLSKPFASEDLLNRVAARMSATQRDQAGRDRDRGEVREATAQAKFNSLLSSARSPEDVLEALLTSTATSLGATAAVIALSDAELNRVRLHHAGALPTELRDRYHSVAAYAPIPIVDVIHSGEPLVIPDTLTFGPRYQVVVQDSESSVRAGVIHPLTNVSGLVYGAISLLWPDPRTFEQSELDVLTEIASRAGLAVDRVRTAQREHRIATDFQDHLLDLDRRSTAAVVSAVYEPATEAMQVGGDWYLVAPLDDPACIGVSVGDVVGHGLPAATVMSKLRSAITAGALTNAAPTAVLQLLERYATTVPGALCSTVAYAVVDTDAHTISYARAGHPSPLVVTPTGTARYLDHGLRPPLAAANLARSSPSEVADFPPGSLLVLYTDGLIERRGESLDEGLARLAAAASECRNLPVNAVCAELLRALTPSGHYTDDVAILALRPAGTVPDSFVIAVPAEGTQVPALRHRFRAWLTGLDLDEHLEHEILLAVGETVSNAIEHGSVPHRGQTVSVEAFATAEVISTTVSDSGKWSGDSSASRRAAVRGRGLTLINGLSERVETVRTSRGTHVTLYHRRTPDPAQPAQRRAER